MVLFLCREVGLRVEWEVEPRWHLAFPDLFDRLVALGFAPASPFRDVALLSSFDDVAIGQESGWCDVGIPAPVGLVRVTVAAGTHEEFACLGTVPGGLSDHRWIGPRERQGDSLQREEQGEQRPSDNECNPFASSGALDSSERLRLGYR